MSFEQFIPNKEKRIAKRSNTIGFSPKLNKLSIYQPTYKKYFNSFEHVHLFYDKDEHLIGIKPVVNQDSSSIKLTGEKAKSLMIGRFLKQYNIEIKETKQFTFQERDGMLIIKI